MHILDLLFSCRRRGNKWLVAMNKWQDITDMEVSQGILLLYDIFFAHVC
jgi:hypothetical protein